MSDATPWDHIWAVQALKELRDDLENHGHHQIAAVIDRHLQTAAAERDQAISESRALQHAFTNGMLDVPPLPDDH